MTLFVDKQKITGKETEQLFSAGISLLLSKAYPAANIEIQSSDSTTGVKSAVSGICDIGMASRDLKKSELEQGLKATVIATDGIAVIVNKDNKVGDLKKEQVEAIFTGKITEWNKL